MSHLWRGPDSRPVDIAEVRRLAQDIEAGDPTVEHYTADEPADMLWAFVLVCITSILIVCGLGLVIVHAWHHWRGALEIGLVVGMAGYFLRRTR